MKIRALLLSVILSAGICTAVSAQEEEQKHLLTISYPNNDSVLVISGDLTEENNDSLGKNENVSIRVLALGEDGEDFVSGGDLMVDISADDVRDNPGMLDFFYVTQSDGEGKYTFKYKTAGQSGYYLFTVTTADGRQETAAYEYYSPEYAMEKIELLNNYIKNNELDNVTQFLIRYTEPLAAGNDYFSKIKNESCFSEAAPMVAAGGEVKDKADLKARMRIVSARTCLKYFKVPDDAAEIINMLNYFTEFGFEKDTLFAATLQKTVAEDVKNSILKDFAEINAMNDAELKKQVDDKILFGAVNYSAWGKIMAVCDENISMFTSSVQSKYSALSDTKKANVAKILYENVKVSPYKDFDTLEDDFEKAIDSQKDGSGSSGGGSGSSGGGGGNKSSGSSIPATSVKDEVKTPVKKTFEDLTKTEWAREAVEALAEQGIVSGRSDSEFAPNDSVTREEFLAIAVRAFGLMDNSAECSFEDVGKDAWYYSAVASAYKAGITSGISDVTFGAGSRITRQDMCVLAYKAAEKAGINLEKGSIEFADAGDIAEYAAEYVSAMSKAGIVSGVGENKFAPLDTATRASAAKIIYELLKLK